MRHFLLPACLLLALSAAAQNTPDIFSGCGTDLLMQRAPALSRERDATDLKIRKAKPRTLFGADHVLPVVVHILHNNGPENISDAQVQQGIAQLNNAFAGLGGAGTPTGIQFCLAQQDPAGLATNGITRNVTPLTNMVMETQDLDVKNTNRWAPTCYINIWVVAEITSLSSGPGVAGYAYFPSSHGSNIDGIVMEAAYFGSSQSNTSVLVHEMGHYLGLYHTFEGGCANNDCLSDGDRVCDTPPDQSTFSSCAPNANSCNTDADDAGPNNPFSTDVPDMGENYMDYSNLSCYTRFTTGQADRMNFHLTEIRASLPACKSCQSPCPAAAVAQILQPATDVTIFAGDNQPFSGALTQAQSPEWRLGAGNVFASGLSASYTFNATGVYRVYFLAASVTPDLCAPALDSVKITVKCGAQAAFSTANDQPNAGTPVFFANQSQQAQNYQWLVDGTAVATSTNYIHNFPADGIYTVQLIASNGLCSDTASRLIFVGCKDESRRGAFWYFGERAGLRFGPGGPAPLTDNAMTAPEGCAVMSDKSGGLLFYSNGLVVYNRNHAVMPNGNGLIGSNMSGQGALIVPAPGNADRYYLFTVNSWLDGQRRLAYSIIDMTLNGGLGDIVAGAKNIVVNSNVAEMVTAVNHRNCRDVWIVTHEAGNDLYMAYLISPGGLNVAPVATQIGNLYTGANRSGSLRASHNGKWLCAAFGGSGIPDGISATLARFDAGAGVVSQVQTLETTGTMAGAFSSEFSLDDAVLYVCSATAAQLHQFDLNSPIIPLSVQTIPTGGVAANALQIGPDGRIYAGSTGIAALHRIDQPEVLGPGCGFTANAVLLAGRNARLGFPNFLSHFFQPSLRLQSVDTICLNETCFLSIPSSLCGATYEWSLSPDLGQITALSDSLARFVSNGTAGSTRIQLIRNTPCSRDTTEKNLFVKACSFCPLLNLDAGKDTVLCAGQSTQLKATPGFATYKWTPTAGLNNPNIADPVAGPAVTTTYTVTTTAPGNEMILNGDFAQGNFGFGTEYIFSGAAVGHFWVSNNPVSINGAWSIPADHSPSADGLMLIVDGDVTGQTPVFWEQDVVLPSNLAFTLRFWVAMAYFAEPPLIRIEINGQIAGTFTPLGGPANVGIWQPYLLNWNSGPNSSLHIALRDMNSAYIGNDFAVDDISIRGACTYSDSVTVTPLHVQPPVLNLGPDIVRCANAVKKLDAGPGFKSYKWQDGSDGQSFTAFGPGKYWVTVKDSCGGQQSDTVRITTAPLPVLDAGLERVICPGDSVRLGYSADSAMSTFHWWPESALSCSTCADPWAKPAQNTTYYLAASTAEGCSALDSVRVRIRGSQVDSLVISACGSYTLGNNVLNSSGIYRDTLQNISGCDSIIHLDLTVYTSVSKKQSLQICAGSSIQIGQNIYSSSGAYVDTLQTAGGCDSILTTVLQVTPPQTATQQVAICQGEGYQLGGHTYNTAGTYIDTLQSVAGCDSIITSQISVLPVWKLQQNLQICQGQSVQVGTNTYTLTGMYSDTLQTQAGCDSIIQTALTVHPSVSRQQNLQICQGDSVHVGAHAYSLSGTYSDTLQTQAGCDSIIQTALTVHPPASRQQDLQICQGDSVYVGAHVYTLSGTYRDTLQTQAGCDSIIRTALVVFPVKFTPLASGICQGDTVFVGAHAYTQAGSYRDTLQTQTGCDSIIQTALQLRQNSMYQLALNICEGDSVLFGGKMYRQSGIFYDTLQNAAGCDSLLRLHLQVLSEIVSSQALQICAGEQVQVGAHVYTESGNYVDILQAGGGCDSIVHTALAVRPVYQSTQAPVICRGESLSVGMHQYAISGEYADTLQTAEGCDSILHTRLTVLDTGDFHQELRWCPGDVIQVGNEQYTTPGNYIARMTGANGCDSTVYTLLTAAGATYCDSARCSLYIPNVFVPQVGGPNQYFEAKPGSAMVLEMQIYDRWGELLYRQSGQDARWDGSFRGQPMLPGVYVYVIQAVCSDGRAFRKVGDVTLVR